jgi:DNA-binding transcriptional regulator YdaS (Cro superfamily)
MEASLTDQSPAARAIALLGGPVKAAIALNVPGQRYQTVQSWLRNRVPAEYCPLIERETRARAKEPDDVVTCEKLRPDVAWEVLRMQAAHDAAPQVATAGQGA